MLRHVIILLSHNDYIWIVRKHFKNQFDDIDFHDMNPYRQFISDGLSHTDIKRIREGKLGAQFWAVYTNCESLHKDALRIHLEQLDAVKRLIRRYPDDMEFVTSTQGYSTNIFFLFLNNKISILSYYLNINL
jgi:membrane dipeptidase